MESVIGRKETKKSRDNSTEMAESVSMDKFRQLLKTLLVPTSDYNVGSPSLPINDRIRSNYYKHSQLVVDQNY